jgi:hypothetical protein
MEGEIKKEGKNRCRRKELKKKRRKIIKTMGRETKRPIEKGMRRKWKGK